ncbi:hypothetical protein [Microlunatus antarcticus]|uniref:Uncharacterized protein n=1 Tax=Microlunatus antarcticus TaxID=53388 RepID=A0A7W5JYX5_9ACTN|nr:hypothetical protein [Microlunatus antarcticus]MBB3328803.1 hypothetical protein [Microlunatus antarcticus]
MQEHVSDAYAFLAVLCLPLVAWILSRPPLWRRIRPRLEPVAVRLWLQVVEQEQPDEGVLRRWAVDRLEQLRGHLERVRRLILDDEHMTATRQVGNRMAHERLVRDVRDAEAAVLAYGLNEVATPEAAPTPRGVPRLAFSAPAVGPVVEVLEFGPGGRWL